MNPEIEENKRLYWEKRHAAEEAWNIFAMQIRKDPRYIAMVSELEQINEKISYEKEYYLCKYEIHPDDLNVTSFESPDDRGGYADTMYRSDHFGYPLVTLQGENYVELTDERPFPMPDGPVYMVFPSQCVQFTLYIESYIGTLCLLCGYAKAKLPLGFICSDCMDEESLRRIYDTEKKRYNIPEMVELRMAQLNNEMNAYRQFANKPIKRIMPKKVINVECYNWQEDKDEPEDVTVRLQLTRCIKVTVCKEHTFDDEGDCCMCRFGCIDY